MGRVVLIIPALDEAETIGAVVQAVDRTEVDEIVVVDNGSADETAAVAAAAGATVLTESRRGYGSACLKALREGPPADVYLFMDGDGSDDPNDAAVVLAPIRRGEVDMVIGSRVSGQAEAGALTPVQAFGNWLTCRLVAKFWGVTYTDLGPFRGITRSALLKLNMADPDFGWTIEMQVKAAQQGLRLCEVPVRYRCRRAGRSKVSGNLIGSFQAGRRILMYVFSAWWHERR
jgi:glycosyltransferase involved in cell wall biosynthesis